VSRRLPPLNSLKAFEAAARHLSFTRAAGELNVTQAAISHQIKGLEDRLGVQLFRRLNRTLLLTDEGQSLLSPVSEALDILAGAVDRLARQEQAGVLTLSTLDSIAASWLVPRIGKFRVLHPDIDVRISSTDNVIDFSSDGIDMGLRYGRGKYPGLECVLLMTESLFPVVSPLLLEKIGPLEKPSDLARFPLLHDDMRDDWAAWTEAAGVPEIDVSRGPAFSHSNHIQLAAVAGEGVALGRSIMVVDNLSTGLLQKPFDIELKAQLAYYAVYPKASAGRPKVVAFRDWLIDEAAETQSRYAEFLGRKK
jgi:LysR family transcriptional regulator, glycine cleavage system transcriptional activator